MISKEEVIKIANLARLELSEAEIEKMQKDLAGILDYIDQLNKIDPIRGGDTLRALAASNGASVSGVEVEEIETVLENVLRKDTPFSQTPETIEKILSQAPAHEGNHIKVKEILT